MLLCLNFSYNLKGIASDWFYSIPPHSLYNSKEVTHAFLTQYASCREAKQNNHRLLTVKMRCDSLKSLIAYFQSQLARVLHCGEDISALTFISKLQVSHPICKYLLKYDVTWMSKILF